MQLSVALFWLQPIHLQLRTLWSFFLNCFLNGKTEVPALTSASGLHVRVFVLFCFFYSFLKTLKSLTL